MYISHLPEFLARLDLTSAAHAMGQAAVSAVREQMLSGYEQPIRRTGALHDDVSYTVKGTSVTIGSTLPYAPLVHDGTSRLPARPYLADGILRSADALRLAAAHSLG